MSLNRNSSESIVSHFGGGIPKKFSKGEILVQGDEEPSGVYWIKSGYVKAYSISQRGQQNLLLIHGANEIMPLPWALDGPQKIGIFYEAMSTVLVLNTSKDSLRSAMGREPWLTEQILRQLVNTFTVYAHRIQNLGFRSPKERVIACLLDLATRFGRPRGQTVVIEAPVTHQDIADSINVTRETASRELEALFRNGLVTQKNHFIVNNEGKLHSQVS